MPHPILQRLQPQFRDKLTEGFLNGSESLDLSAFVEPADPYGYDISPLVNIIEFAMGSAFSGSRPVDSDKWLAPRVHSALRLTRRQASDRGIWDWLATGPLRPYVRWRWETNGNVVAARYSSSDMNRQAIARLWWGAELTRNGADYSATEILFEVQDIQNVWSVARFFRNRPVAIAALRFLATFNGGKYATGDQVKTLGKAFNAILTTTVLDSVSAGPEVDVTALREWFEDEGSRDETKWQSEMPEGPPEQKFDEEDVQRVHALLEHLVSVTPMSQNARPDVSSTS